MEDDSWGSYEDPNIIDAQINQNGSMQNITGFCYADEDPDEDSNSHQSEDVKEKKTSSPMDPGTSFFAQDTDSDTDNDADIHSFYQEESTFQPSFSQSSAPIFSQLSQSSNLSHSELSHMDESAQESMFSQSSHRDIEVDRQQKKMERKRKRKEQSLFTKKRPKYHLSEEQRKRGVIYHRFKYEKRVDVSQERDVGGSIEYLVRQKLKEPGEQIRLLKIAKERELLRIKKEEEEHNKATQRENDLLWGMADRRDNAENVASVSLPNDNQITELKANKSGLNWNFLEDGFITMPKDQAKELPYYIYNISNRNLRQTKGDEKFSNASDSSEQDEKHTFVQRDPSERRNTKHSDRDTNMVFTPRRRRRKLIKWDTSSHPSLPLHFNQLNTKMDLRSFTTMNSLGQDDMALLHGRIAKRLWARLVAGGVTLKMMQEYNKLVLVSKMSSIKDEDSASEISHSSESSESYSAANTHGGSDFRSQYSSETVFRSQPIIGVDQVYHREIQNPVARLMSLVHTLPNITHRNRFYIKNANELGGLRVLWENEFKPLITYLYKQNKVSSMEIKALQSFLGVDGNISPGPFWYSDPAMHTDITKLYTQMLKYRTMILRRLKELMNNVAVGKHEDEVASPITNAGVDKASDITTNRMNKNVCLKIKAEQPSKTNVDVQTDNSKVEVETEAAIPSVEDTSKLIPCMLDTIPLDDSSGDTNGDKYAKIMHESNFDVTNMYIALSSFLNELTASKAQIYNFQQLDTPSPLERGNYRSAERALGIWNRIIDEYLSLAEKQSRPPDMNLYKRDGKVPQHAPFAQTVLARQAYVSNRGIIGHKNSINSVHRPSSQLSDMKEEEEEGYESEDSLEEEGDNNGQSSGQKELESIRLSASDIVKRGKEYLINESLQHFAPIHFTTGVAMLSEHLTPVTTEIISRPSCFDSKDEHTPFDLIKKTLTCLDNTGELISNPTDSISRWDARGKVVDEILVNSWENATTIFRRCIREDSQNLDYWTWYVATLLGIVCVSSAVPLSSNANDFDAYCENDASGRLNNPAQEKQQHLRYQLDFYDEKRKHALQAVRDFIDITNKFDCPMFHSAVCSMLEWNCAITLMDEQKLDDTKDLSISAVKRLYVHHVSFKKSLSLLICRCCIRLIAIFFRLITGR